MVQYPIYQHVIGVCFLMKKMLLLGGLSLIFLASACSANTEMANMKTSQVTPTNTSTNSNKESSTDAIVKAYMEKGNIKLTSKDVQYDIQNNLDKDFVINGMAKISNYYNYGFTNEKTFFNVSVQPDGGELTEQWNLYFSREKNSELFDILKKGEVYIIAQGNVPSKSYQKGQRNMAVAGNAIWVNE